MKSFDANQNQAPQVLRWIDPETGKPMAVGHNGSPLQGGQPLELPKRDRKVGHPAFDRLQSAPEPKAESKASALADLRLHPNGKASRQGASAPTLRIV